MKPLFSLFLTFAKLGALTFGGGYAMLPMITKEITERKKWATEEEILDYIAVAQCTPGIIAVNVATFVGAKKKGIPGAVAATLGVIFPSIVIILCIASLLQNYGDNPTLQNAFAGIRLAVCALITVTVVKLARKTIDGVLTAVIAVGAFMAVAFFGVSPAIIAPSAGLLGALYAVIIARRKER